ncbi:acyl-CoA-binding domain-containing protein 3-like protein [Tanacetum coccineum]
MELFQELVFTISLSLIVSLLIAKLFSLSSASSSDVDNEKIDNQDWVVCDKNDKDLSFQDDDFGSGVVIDDNDDDKVFDEMPERSQVENYVKTDEGNVVECDLGSLVQEDLGSSVVDVGEVKVEEEDVICEDDDDDDWQGIETTELEKRFGAAVAFMGSKSSGERMDNDVKVELYGLQKVANEGSCFEPQPMALKVSARANWNSWKRLENLGREDAMEQYIALLSRHVPDWMGTHTSLLTKRAGYSVVPWLKPWEPSPLPQRWHESQTP